MRKANIGLAPEGYPVIGLLSITALSFGAAGCEVVAFIALVLLWFAVHFFRDPERVTPHAPGLGISPADGKIIRIATREDPFTGEERICISIFMNVFSVHVNRTPVAGTITDMHYHPGAFVNAAWDKASHDNERCAWQVQTADGEAWTFVQIAGLIARRIVCRAEIGDTLARGERVGMIRFGSRVDLYLPQGYEPSVRIGETVFAGQTAVARETKNEGENENNHG